MGWSVGFDEKHQRDIGYGVPAVCDHPECNETINRGLPYVCGGEPYGGEAGCGLFFCSEHYGCGDYPAEQLCERCAEGASPFDLKPDIKLWVDWKLTHESWAQWRQENPDIVVKLRVV